MKWSTIIFSVTFFLGCSSGINKKKEIDKKNDTINNNVFLPVKKEDSLPSTIFHKIETYIQVERKIKLISGAKYLTKEIEGDSNRYFLIQYCRDDEIRMAVLFNFLYDKKSKKLYYYSTLNEKKILIN
jgi:hypothetical protein